MEECLSKHQVAQPNSRVSDGHTGAAVQKCPIHDPPSAARYLITSLPYFIYDGTLAIVVNRHLYGMMVSVALSGSAIRDPTNRHGNIINI